MEEFTVLPNPDDPRLTRRVEGIDQDGRAIETSVVTERPLTLFLNGREIVTMMTIGDHPNYLAVGYLLNQNMLGPDDHIIGIDYDEDIDTVVVRTDHETDFEDKLKKKTLTSGCAQGTVFGDLMERFEEVKLDRDAVLRTSWLYALTRKINTAPSLYLAAGAIHGCVLCEEDRPLLYMEDVGRHNAVDKIAGYMHLNGVSPAGKSFYTTGRLTSEMVIKTVQMGIPILVSRSGFTAWGVELARQAGLTLIGRAKGKRFVALAGTERIVFDLDPRSVADEPARLSRKSGRWKRTRRRERGRHVVGLLLAGGQSRRMGGGDKSLRLLGDRPLLAHVIERMRPQVTALVLNANGDPARFAAFGLPVVADSVPDFAGPLAGILAGLDWAAANRPDCPMVASVATDAPFLPSGSCGAAAARPRRRRRRSRLRRVRRAGASGHRVVAGPPARAVCAGRLSTRTSARSIAGPAVTSWRPCRLRRTIRDRPILQRQPARRS